MPLNEADIQADLDRRRPGTSRHVTQRSEPDAVEILSGVYEGRHDPCVGIRAAPIAEALLALVVMEHALHLRAQSADVSQSVGPIEGSV